jgi:hypothetical protein
MPSLGYVVFANNLEASTGQCFDCAQSVLSLRAIIRATVYKLPFYKGRRATRD